MDESARVAIASIDNWWFTKWWEQHRASSGINIYIFNKTKSRSSDLIVWEAPSIFARQTQQILQFHN